MSTEPLSPARRPAPPSVEPVRQFLNTLDIEERRDALNSPEAALRWLGERDICDAGCTSLSESDAERLRSFREAVRDFVQYGGAAMPGASRTLLEAEMAACPLLLTFCGDDGGDVRLRPAGTRADAAVAWILASIRESQLAGEWQRLHICDADTCRWAFYDHSRNGSARWCDMALCGNRAKARRHRERTAQSA